MSSARSEGRQRGRIEERGKTLRVIVYAGVDPVTGKRSYLRETIDGTDKVARKRAEKALNRMLAQVDGQRSAPSSTSLSFALDEWMRTNEIEASTRKAYLGYIDRTIRPALGTTAVNKITARTLEGFYTDLRRCRVRCDGKPYIQRHKKTGKHDCANAGCKPHECKPMAASTVRQIHFIISGTLDAAERWDWISSNPARVVRKPKQKPPEPDPPTPDAAVSSRYINMGERLGIKTRLHTLRHLPGDRLLIRRRRPSNSFQLPRPRRRRDHAEGLRLVGRRLGSQSRRDTGLTHVYTAIFDFA